MTNEGVVTAFSARHLTIAGISTWLCVALAIAAPRGAPVLLLGWVFSQFLIIGPSHTLRACSSWYQNSRGLRYAALPLTLMLFVGYSALACTWSASPASAVEKVAWLAVAILATSFFICICRRGALPLERMRTALLTAYIAGVGYVLIELSTGMGILRSLYNVATLLRPASTKHFEMFDGNVAAIAPYVLNRNMGAVTLLLWPAVAVLSERWSETKSKFVAALVVIVFLCALGSEHESSAIAVAASSLICMISRTKLPLGRAIVIAGWCAAVLLVLPASLVSYAAGLQNNTHIPWSGRARITIWHHTTQEFVKAPWFGVGVDSTRYEDDKRRHDPSANPALLYENSTGQHSHNLFLQTWFELGAIGAVLLLLVGVAIWTAIDNLRDTARPAAYASFTSAIVIGSFTWGMWQQWYLALFGLSFAFMGLASCNGLKRA